VDKAQNPSNSVYILYIILYLKKHYHTVRMKKAPTAKGAYMITTPIYLGTAYTQTPMPLQK
jgi:hypothetical protein